MAKSHNKRDSSSNSKESKTASLYRCEVCKIEIASLNRESHENGRKHKNKEAKLQRKSRKQKADTSLAVSDEGSKNSEAPNSEIPVNSHNYSISPEDSCKPEEQSPGTAQVNSAMSNQSNRNIRQKRYNWESETDLRYRPIQNPYRSRGHYAGFRPPHRGNLRNYNNRNFGWQPWHQESVNSNNVERSNYFAPPPMPVRRYFSSPIPNANLCDVNPFFPDMESSYDAFDSNENFYPFDKRKFPSKTSTETLDSLQASNNSQVLTLDDKSKKDSLQASTKPANDEKNTTSEPSITDASDKAKSQKPKSIRRRTQSVREITNASLAARSSIDSDETLDATGDKQERKNSVSESTTGKKIAQWINPSNRKDEAEIRRLVTEFSKSKKKENLLKLKQQSESRMERNESDELITNIETDKLAQSFPINTCVETPPTSNLSTAPNSKEALIITNIEIDKSARAFPKDTSVEMPSTSNQNTTLNSKTRTTLSSESVPDLLSPNFRRPVTKVSSTKASPRKRVGSLQSEPGPVQSSSGQKKRKSSTEKSSSKVKKFTNSQDLEACLNSVVNVIYDTSLVSDTSVSSAKSQSLPEKSVSEKVVSIVKKEPSDSIENDIQSFADSLNLDEFLQNQGNLDNNCSSEEATMTPVESLINLFASGNVIVKKEFDDPVIDAIRTVDPAVFDRVCDSQSTTSKKGPVAPPAEKPLPVAPPAEKPLPVAPPAEKTHPSVTGSLKAILKQLQKISEKELKIKGNLQEAEQKIQEYQLLLEEWKTKKIKFQSEEDYLGHQRNTLVNSMNDLVTEDCSVPNNQEECDQVDSTTFNTSSETPSIHSNLLSSVEGPSTNEAFTLPENSNNDQIKTSTLQKSASDQNNIQSVEEEVAILPIPSTADKKEVPIIDLDEAYPFKESNFSSSIGTLLAENTVNDKLSEWKVLSAHEVVINSIQVFEDYLYTSSIDNTARRFNLKDLSETVTYYHEKKNVTLLCVEKVNGMTVVFTACAASNVVSLFKAEDGTFINSFKFASNVASLCKGKDKIYVGLRNGYIFTCNQKEQKEIVYIGDPIRSIALTYQGCISILVTLAVNGSVSIRDAERNGLLIRTVKPQKNVPLFMTVDGDCIYLSGSGVLMGIEIGTARCVQLFDLIAPYTSLTVYQGNIFTTSYSGLVRCHSKKMDKAVTVYYGAGNTALTCINVYNGWVFTGNRFGAVDVFKFEPNTFLPCQLGKCDLIFSREKDLLSHVLLGRDHDLPSAGSKCSWRTCREKIPHQSDLEVIKCHIREHIQASAFQDHFDL